MEGHASVNSITLTMWKLEDLPTHQVFSTNEPWEGRAGENGLARGARSEAPIWSPHRAPGASHQRKSANPARLGSATRDREESLRRSRTGSGAHEGPVKSGFRHPRSPFTFPRCRPWEKFTPCPKNRTLTTGLSSQVPLATTSDLKQKHLISFLNPRKKRSGLPEVTKKWRTEDEAEAPAAEPPCNTASPCLFASKQLQNGKAWK